MHATGAFLSDPCLAADVLLPSHFQSNNRLGPRLVPDDINFHVVGTELSVDLSNNMIQLMPLRPGFNMSQHNFLLNLTGNPLLCDCNLLELRNKVGCNISYNSLENTSYLHIVVYSGTCIAGGGRGGQQQSVRADVPTCQPSRADLQRSLLPQHAGPGAVAGQPLAAVVRPPKPQP